MVTFIREHNINIHDNVRCVSVSLNIRQENTCIRIRYNDSERSGEVTIDLKENKIILHEIRNLRIILESFPQPVAYKPKVTEKERKVTRKIFLGDMRQELKKEILHLLNARQAFSPESSLSLDDILEIAQYEKEVYPMINKLINESKNIALAKRLLALVMGSLRREGKIMRVELETEHGKIMKYFTRTR